MAISSSAHAIAAPSPRQFRVWAFGCAHVGSDLRRGRQSLAEAIRHSEFGGDEGGPPFDWDIALDLGDLSGTQHRATDEEGAEIVRQFATSTKHPRGDFYDLAGNHDASLPGEASMAWFKKWVDPTGMNSQVSRVDPRERRFAVEGTWERYTFRVGNLAFLMMSDRNDGGPPIGRSASGGGYPSGAVTGETFDWWRDMVESRGNDIIVSAHHHMLKDTTVASGAWEGLKRRDDGTWASHYHGYFADGGPEGSSYLYYVDGKPDAQAFERYLADRNGAIDLWLGGHTHTHPDDTTGGRSHIERKWGVNFVNAAALAKHHARTTMPMSRLLIFTEGSDQVRVRCYLHTSQHAPQGWYDKAERTLTLGRAFRF